MSYFTAEKIQGRLEKYQLKIIPKNPQISDRSMHDEKFSQVMQKEVHLAHCKKLSIALTLKIIINKSLTFTFLKY